MLTIILGYLSGLRLSLKQLALGLVAGVFGYLIIRLKMQGSALHLAQAQLLQAKYEATSKEDDDTIAAAKVAMEKAIGEYEDAKKL